MTRSRFLLFRRSQTSMEEMQKFSLSVQTEMSTVVPAYKVSSAVRRIAHRRKVTEGKIERGNRQFPGRTSALSIYDTERVPGQTPGKGETVCVIDVN